MLRVRPLLLSVGLLAGAGSLPTQQLVRAAGPRIVVQFPASRSTAPLDGRLLVILSTDTSAEPRFQISDISETQLIFGQQVDGWRPGTPLVLSASAPGYPIRSLGEIPPGRYRIQAVLNRYETFHLAGGQVVTLPPDRGEGQQWNQKPGNLYSTPQWMEIRPWPRRMPTASTPPEATTLLLDQEIPGITPLADTRYVRHERIQSTLLTKFWGRPMYLGAHVLLPEGFDSHPNARYPLVIDHGHFPATFEGWRETPPDTTITPEYSERFHLPAYNRIQEAEAYHFYQEWTGPAFPRVLLIQIQHPTPYYDDSYAVNSAANGPYGDAIMHELLPYLEQKYRGIGQGYARFAYGGSTGGWEAMAVQLFYPDDFNGVWAACPDPVDFRQFTVVNIYDDTNAYYATSRWKRIERPAHRDYLGNLSTTVLQSNQLEDVLASHGRSGGQWDVWQSVYSPADSLGYPQPIWNKRTGTIDHAVAQYWRDHYDLGWMLRRDWATLGPKVRGKLHIYVGEADNYFLNDAVYLVEQILTSATHPAADAEVDYEPRAEHCWNGDHTRPNAYSRLRYAQMFIPRIMEQIRKNHPADADTTSWRY